MTSEIPKDPPSDSGLEEDKEVYISTMTLQRMLTISADIVQEKLYLSDYNPPGIVLTSQSGSSNIQQSLFNQQQLFSDAIYDSGDTVHNLFKDNTEGLPIDNSYIVKNTIMFYLNVKGVPSLFYFDIDSVNLYNKGKFFISKVVVKNKPKDSFTLKAFYEVDLSISFSSFDDLLNNNVIARSCTTNDTIAIPLITLLYKFVNDDKILKDNVDPNGLFLIQDLYLDKDDQRYQKFIKFNNGSNVISKNYHLSFHKHSFEVFKDNTPTFKLYENELNISFIAYDSPGDNSNTQVPQMDGNLYSLVLDSDQLKTQIKNITESINKLSKQLGYCQKNNSKSPVLITIEKKLENFVKAKNEIVSNLNERLIETILTRCNRYVFKAIPYNIVNIYNRSLRDEKISEIIKWSALGALAIAGSAIMGATGIGAIGSAVLGVGATQAISTAVELWNSKQLVINELNLDYVRMSIKNSSLKQIKGDNVFKIKEPVAAGQLLDDEGRKKRNEDIKKAYDNLYALKAEMDETKTDKPIDLYFTTFGDIIRVVKESIFKDTNIIYGGYVMTLNDDQKYINFANIPISLNKFSKFLYSQMVESDRNLNYSVEVFIRDCYEQLIRGSLYESYNYLSKRKASISTNVKMAVSTHRIKKNDPEFRTRRLDLNLTERFDAFKRKFLISKNLSVQSNNSALYKFITIANYQDSLSVDFFSGFKDQNRDGKYSSLNFQKYINKNYMIPCVLLNKESKNESLLKKKYINFTRIDNSSLTLGNILQSGTLLRYPYKISADLKAFCSFFVTPGSYLFVAPPSSKMEYDMFGYGGLYIIMGSKFEYYFQRVADGKLTLPNFESTYSIEGQVVSTGITENQAKKQIKDNTEQCDTPASSNQFRFSNPEQTTDMAIPLRPPFRERG